MDYSDEEEFSAASKYMRATNVKLDNDKKLKLYGLFKQATERDCHTSKPGFLDMTGRAKWTAWNDLKGLTKSSAMAQYVSLVTAIDPGWKDSEVSEAASAEGRPEASPFGLPTVSTMVPEDNFPKKADAEKTIMEVVVDGNVDRVRALVAGNPSIVLLKDDDGMTALHWASDRGSEELVNLLLDSNADINAQDAEGQTPLHYAVSCDHVKLVPILLEKGASLVILDSDGSAPAALAESKEMRAALKALALT